MSTAATGAEGITIAPQGAVQLVTLDRPAQLNALTLGMRAALAAGLPRFARDPQTYAMVLRSASERAFSVGGDIREMSELWARDPAAVARGLADEYALSWQLDCFTKPTVSLIDGLVMGSGVGLSLYGTHRVAGEGYAFAMPETAIGLFPDVGVAHAFARMPDNIGMYLALTGARIGRADALALKLVTHCVPRARLGEIVAGLADAQCVDPLLDERHVDPGPNPLDARRETIARCFSAESLEEIAARLRNIAGADRDFVTEAAATIATRSPTSLKVSHHLVRMARSLDLRAVLELDHRLAVRCFEGHDLREGIRAMVIDKDRTPRWAPARLEDVTEAMVDAHFAPLAEGALELKSRTEMQSTRG